MHIFLSRLLCAGIAVSFSACTTHHYLKTNPHAPEVYKKYVIELDAEGRHENRTLPGESAELTEQEHFNTIISHLAKHLDSNKKKILLHFHGGMNSQATAFRNELNKTADIYKDSVYPIFINWHSGPFTSYFQHVNGVASGLTYRKTRKIANRAIVASDMLGGVARMPSAIFNTIDNEIENIGNYNKDGWKFRRTRKNTMAIYSELESRMDADHDNQIKVQWGKDMRRNPNIWKGARTIVLGLAGVRFAGLVLWDGAGTPAWNNMKRRAHALIHPPQEFDIRDYADKPECVSRHLSRHDEGVLAGFLDTLTAYLKTRNDTSYEITIVGHSMGAMVVNDVLQHYPDFPATNVVHMAAASPLNELETSVIPYLKRHDKVKFYCLMLQPASENREHMALGILIPRGGLLVHVDNLFENPESFLCRTEGRWENMMQASHLFPDDIKHQVTLKSFDADRKGRVLDKERIRLWKDGRLDTKDNALHFQPQKHGQFDDAAFWRPEYWQIRE